MMSDDDDDDGVEPQIEDVNEYHFEDGDGEPVCFSILPFQFGENDNEADFFRKNVFLHGFVDKSLPVYKKVVAWKIRLDTEQPNIYVLSIQHKWIKLLKPRKCYGEFARSILITVQMLHFVRRGGQRSLNHLWDRLDEVSGKFNPKPATDDLMKHQNLIKLFVEKDQTLMKSKILQRLIENRFKRTKKALGLEAQVIVSSTRRVRKNDDNNYGNKDGSGDDCDDGDGSSNGDESSDDDDESSDDDDGTDQICAICDDGGQLLSCEGPCKRSFHATKKDGRESKCETLGYTSAEVERMGTFLCANCKKKQHQCSSCGELEPSHGPNAKVFQCNKASCGYFYHPKCIAQLLDPNATDRACELERRIMTGMSFRCPIHWCFKCGRMENKTQRALQLAVCRRCPKAYHRECLPRELSLGAKDKDGNPRAWELSKTIFIYCLDHEIDKDIGAASRNHIKFPATPECTKTKRLGNSKGRMTVKRRKNTDQSTKPTELSNRLCGAESEQADNVGAKSTSPQIVVEPHCAAKLLKGDPQIEQSIIGVAASQNGAETMKGHEKQFGISSCVASTETEKRVTCSAGTPYDGRPSTKGMSDCSVQDTPVDRDVELDNVACRITEDKYANGREKTQEGYTRKETAHHKDSSENQGQNDVLGLGNLWVDIQADGSPLEPGNKRDKEWQENAYGLGSILGQEKETSSRRENPQSDRGMVPRNDSQIIDYRKGGTTVDTGTASRNHIQFLTSPECTKTKELGNSKGRMTGRRRKNTDQSIKPTELSNRLCGAESEQADNVGAKSTSPQIVVEPHCVAKRFKDDPQIEQSIIGVGASQNGAEIMNGHEKQFVISSRVASTETEKRVPYLAQKGTCLGTPYDGPSTKDMSDCSVQDTPVDKDVELDNVACRIMEDKYANGREKTQEDYTRKETAHRKDSSENQGQNDVLELDNLWVEIQADGSPLEPGNKRDKEENAHGLRSASGQEKETSSKRENPESDRGMVPMNNSKTIHYRKGGTTLDNVDDHSSEGSYQCQVECNCSKCNDGLVAIDQDTSSDRSKRRSQPVEKASDGNKMYLDKDKKHNLKEDGRDAHYEDRRTERNTAADTSRYKCRDKIQLDRREQELVGRYTRARSSEHSPERQRMERDGSYPGTYNRRRYESLHNFNPPRSGCDDRRQLSPCQSSFPLPEFCGDHSHLYPRDSTSGRHNPHRYMGIPQYRPYMAASAAGHSAVCYRLAGGYGEGSRASRPVTDWYAPHLDRTNCQPRSQIDLQLQASRPVTDKYAPQLELTNYPPRSQSDLQYCTTTI